MYSAFSGNCLVSAFEAKGGGGYAQFLPHPRLMKVTGWFRTVANARSKWAHKRNTAWAANGVVLSRFSTVSQYHAFA
jgi:hypothetical protein